jgi:hypothetical protein
MELFISYSRSARDAETELLRLFETRSDAQGHRSIFVQIEGDGWSPMLPGIVCDIEPSSRFETHPATFIGFLDDDSLITCKLNYEFTSSIDSTMMQLLDAGARAYGLGALAERSHYAKQDRINYIASVPDESIIVRSIQRNSIASTTIDLKHAERPGAAGRPVVESILALTQGAAEEANEYFADALSLLFETLDGTGHTSSVRRLAWEHNFRFAWTSMRLGRRFQSALPISVAMNYRTFKADFKHEEAAFRKKLLYAFWLGQEPLMLSPSAQRSMFIGSGNAPALPSWFRFLILISAAGRRVNAKLRSYNFPKLRLLRLRMRGKEEVPNREGDSLSGRRDPQSKTSAELFRGVGGPRRRKVRRHKMPRERRKELLLKLERILYASNRDTIVSLYRGRRGPVPAGMQRPGRKR